MRVKLIAGGLVAVAMLAGVAIIGRPYVEEALAASSKPAAKPAPTPATRPAAKPAATAAPQPAPAATTDKAIGDWIYACSAATADQPPLCSIVQKLSDSKTNSTIFIWRISKDRSGTLVTDWQTPTGILVNRGVLLDAGTPKPIAVPFTSCTNQHCDAIANLAADFIQSLGATAKASATIYSLDGKGLTFNFSVKGLKDALAALQQ